MQSAGDEISELSKRVVVERNDRKIVVGFGHQKTIIIPSFIKGIIYPTINVAGLNYFIHSIFNN